MSKKINEIVDTAVSKGWANRPAEKPRLQLPTQEEWEARKWRAGNGGRAGKNKPKRNGSENGRKAAQAKWAKFRATQDPAPEASLP